MGILDDHGHFKLCAEGGMALDVIEEII